MTQEHTLLQVAIEILTGPIDSKTFWGTLKKNQARFLESISVVRSQIWHLILRAMLWSGATTVNFHVQLMSQNWIYETAHGNASHARDVHTCIWIGVGFFMPLFFSSSRIHLGSFKSSKAVTGGGKSVPSTMMWNLCLIASFSCSDSFLIFAGGFQPVFMTWL